MKTFKNLGPARPSSSASRTPIRQVWAASALVPLLACSPTPEGPAANQADSASARAPASPAASASPAPAGQEHPELDFSVVERWHLCDKDDLAGCTAECQRGHQPSCVRLGNIYLAGRVVGQDLPRAAGLYELACTLGIGVACSNLASVLVRQGDVARAAQAERRACELDEADGCYRLGYLYENGSGVVASTAQAAGWFTRACDMGQMKGCAELGLLLMEGDGVARDAKRGVGLLQRACDAGNSTACGNLGSAYLVGAGVARDRQKAGELHRKACDGGEENFCKLLQRAAGAQGGAAW